MEPAIIEIPAFTDERGTVAVLEQVQFDIKRVFYIYEVADWAVRGRHALRTCHQILVAVTGKLQVNVDGQSYLLDSPDRGLYIPPLAWRALVFLAEGTICLVVASELYDENDYIEDRNELKRLRIQRAV